MFLVGEGETFGQVSVAWEFQECFVYFVFYFIMSMFTFEHMRPLNSLSFDMLKRPVDLLSTHMLNFIEAN